MENNKVTLRMTSEEFFALNAGDKTKWLIDGTAFLSEMEKELQQVQQNLKSKIELERIAREMNTLR